MLEIQTRLILNCEEEIIIMNCKLVVHHYLLLFTKKFLFIGNDCIKKQQKTDLLVQAQESPS